MGQEVSIVNETNVYLHVALKHLGPVYYENYLGPGEQFTRNVPSFWYTVEAKLASSDNQYSDGQVAAPIVVATATSAAIAGVGAVMVGPAVSGVAAVASLTPSTLASATSRMSLLIYDYTASFLGTTGGFVVPALLGSPPQVKDESIKIAQERLNKIVLSKKGIFIGKKRNCLIITGGPPTKQVTVHPNFTQEIRTEPDFPALDLITDVSTLTKK